MFIDTLESRRLLAVIVGTQLQVTGGAGNDTIKVSQQDAATLRVEQNGAVSFFSDASVNTILINGNGGNDTLQMISTAALPLTEPGTINGGDGNDNMLGADGGDALNGGNGNDGMNGGKGSDKLDGGTGANGIHGGDGNDSMTADTGKDVFDGGAGIDQVSYAARTVGVNVTLDNVANDGQFIAAFPPHFENDNVPENVENVLGGGGNDFITAGPGVINNFFSGGNGNDRLNGRAGNDVLNCGNGDDTGIGGAGNDPINGDAGNDILLGGFGNDNLQGGAGNDTEDGGTGNDIVFGGDGNDILLTADGGADAAANGGNGFDILDKDPGDPAPVGVELIV